MFNVKSRKLVLTFFCSLALVLVLTDGASANAQLDGHRMLRKRLPEVLGRDSTSDIINDGTVGDSKDPSQGGSPAPSVPPVSATVSVNISLFMVMSRDANLSCPLVLNYHFELVTPTFPYARFLEHPYFVLLPDLRFQSEHVLFGLFVLLFFHNYPTTFHPHPGKQ